MRRAAIAAAVALLLPAVVWGQDGGELPIDVQVPQALVVGEARPFFKVQARAAVQSIKVTVTRRGFRKLFRVARLGAGQSRTFRWNERPGLYGYSATVQVRNGDITASQDFTWELAYLPPIKLQLHRNRIDLSKRQLTFQLNHPAERAELVIRGPNGVTLTRVEEQYDGADPGTALTISWPELRRTITRIELTAHGTAGHWAGSAITPWSVSIPHEEVEFESDRWEVRSTEAPKLDHAIAVIQKTLREHGREFAVNLYVGGFTDTVGSPGHNRDLSQKRAQSIARYFASHDVRLPIYYRGFGEEVLAVSTPDETDEARNRRAVYILGTQPPSMSKRAGRGGWRRLGR